MKLILRANLVRSAPTHYRKTPFVDNLHSRGRCCRALKQPIEPEYFQDVYLGAADRIIGSAGYLKREETLVMVESIKSIEHAYKTLELIERHLANRAGQDVNDWHHRKKYYMRICEIALKLERGPDVIFAIFGNMQRFQLSTYFAKEAIERLASKGAHPGILLRIAEMWKQQRGPTDKGVRSAFAELIDVLEVRNTPLDLEFLEKSKAGFKALRSGVIAQDRAAVPVTNVQPAIREVPQQILSGM